MSKIRRPRAALPPVAAALLILYAASGDAQTIRPVQVSLLTPVQIFAEEDTIAGLRLNVLYGRNAGVIGLDLGLVNRTRTSSGVQAGIVGINDERFVGLQYHVVSIGESIGGAQSGFVAIAGDLQGLQNGLVTVGSSVEGMQYGLVNYASSVRGFQLGLVNYAGTLRGLQIGLGNIIAEGGWLPFFPIFNFGL